ncbi:MAG: hypothetical protein MJE68_13610 [Proteobacteria bacterium]|nr:hypothetical protein [Pseudomonadota bacterium]
MADRPFTFETELDDLPKERLKGDEKHGFSKKSLTLNLVITQSPELIYEEIIKFVSCNDGEGCLDKGHYTFI